MTKYLRISSYIREPFLLYDCATAPIVIYEENFIYIFDQVAETMFTAPVQMKKLHMRKKVMEIIVRNDLVIDEWSTVNAKVAKVLGSVPASSDTV